MVEEVVVRTAKQIRLGDVDVPLREDSCQQLFVDVVTERRHMSNVVYISLGALSADGGAAHVDTACRLRMSLMFAQNLRDILSALIDDALKPVDKSQAN